MTANDGYNRIHSSDAQFGARLDSLCRELSRSGDLCLSKIASTLDDLAPTPGHLVLVHAKKLGIRLNGLEPEVFSAIDMCSLLQVAQVYLTSTIAAAVSFINFTERSFPFRISAISTCDVRPFHNPAGAEARRDFTTIIQDKGIPHSMIADPSRDLLYQISSKLMFDGITGGTIVRVSEEDLERELARFLFYHNNFRSIPWIQGLTPVKKLAAFKDLAAVGTFDPYRDPSDPGHGNGTKMVAEAVPAVR